MDAPSPERAACPLCGSIGEFAYRAGDLFYRVTDYRADLYTCSGCDSLFQWPVPDAETISSFYPAGYWRESSGSTFLERCQALYVAAVLKLDLMTWFDRLNLPGEAAFLDFGCGRGDWLAAIKKKGFRAKGLEVDSRAVEIARDRFGLDVRQGDAASWRPEPESLDAIGFFHLLEHLPAPQEFLQKCRVSLKPGGKLLLRVPNLASLQYRLLRGRWKGLEMPRHLVMYRPASLTRLLCEQGFRVLSRSTWSLRDGPPAFASSLFPGGEPTRQQILAEARPFSSILYLVLNSLLTPVEGFAAMCGKGAMLTMIAAKS